MRMPFQSTAVLLLLLLAVFLTLLTFHPVTDDYWVNVVVGRQILDTGSIPTSDVFSYSESDREWLPHMWLSRVFMAAVDQAGGLDATRLTFLLLAFGFVLAVGSFHRSLGLGPWGMAFGMCLVFLLSMDRFRYRPTIFTMAFLYAGLAFLVAYWNRPRWWHAPALYLFTALWVNLHSGGLIFPLVVCAMAGADIVARLWKRDRPTGSALHLAAAAATVLGSLTTPYTYRLWIYIFEPKPMIHRIPEYFSPLSFLHPDRSHLMQANRIPLMLLPSVALLLIAWPVVLHLGRTCVRAIMRRNQAGELVDRLRQLPESLPLTWMQLAVSAPLLYLAMRHTRFLYMTGIPLAFLLARRRKAIAEHKAVYAVAVVATIACLGFASWVKLPHLVATARRPSVHLHPATWPIQSTEFLQEHGAQGRIFCSSVQWNGYLLYHLYPSCRTFYDTRHTYLGARVSTEAREIHHGTPRQSELLRRYDVNIIVARGAFRFAPEEQGRWRLVYRAAEAPFDAVYVRGNSGRP